MPIVSAMQLRLPRALPAITSRGRAFGDSPWPIPEPLRQILDENRRPKLPPNGLPELRQSAASVFSKELGLDFTAKNVSVSPAELLVYDANLIIPSPASALSVFRRQSCNGKVRWIQTTKENEYKLTAEQLYDEAVRAPQQTQILMMSTVNELSGATYSSDEIQEIASILRRFKMLCFSDESRSPLTFHGVESHSIATHYPEGTVVATELSKWCGTGGRKLECFVFPDTLEWLQDAMTLSLSTPAIQNASLQLAACSAFEHYYGGEVRRCLEISRTVQNALAFKAFRSFNDVGGCTVHRPKGGFNIFPDFTEVTGLKEQCRRPDNASLSLLLLKECGVRASGGSCFGRDLNEFTVGFSLADFNGAAIIENADTMPSDVESEEMEAFIAKYCPQTVRGLEAVRDLLSQQQIAQEESECL